MTLPADIISKQRAKVADLERALATARSELSGMERLAAAMGGLTEALMASTTHRIVTFENKLGSGKSGRQPGAITRRWREIFEVMAGDGWVAVEQVIDIVRLLDGREMRPAEVRRLFETHIAHGYLEQQDGRYRVSNLAIEKFGLKAAPNPPAAKANPQENEPPHFLDGFVEEGGGSDTAQDAQ